jgi:hypothetical protein
MTPERLEGATAKDASSNTPIVVSAEAKINSSLLTDTTAALFAEGVQHQLLPGNFCRIIGSLPVLLAIAEQSDDSSIDVLKRINFYENRYS